MVNYAMVCKNIVIDILFNQDVAPVYPPDQFDNPITAVPCNDSVQVGMIYDFETGLFNEQIVEEYVPLFAEHIQARVDKNYANTKSSILIIMESIADQYEQQELDKIANMEVQATIYEEITSLKERLGGI